MAINISNKFNKIISELNIDEFKENILIETDYAEYYNNLNTYSSEITTNLIFKAQAFASFDIFKIVFDEYSIKNDITKCYDPHDFNLFSAAGFYTLNSKSHTRVTQDFIKKIFYLIIANPEQALIFDSQKLHHGNFLRIVCLCFTEKMINAVLNIFEPHKKLLKISLNSSSCYSYRSSEHSNYKLCNVKTLDLLYHNNHEYSRVNKKTINRVKKLGAKHFSLYNSIKCTIFGPTKY